MTDSTAATCDYDNFDSASNICYKYDGGSDNWQDANMTCGGFLAVITNETENLIVKDIM